MNKTLLDLTAVIPLLPTLLRQRARSYYPQFAPYLAKSDRILDVGCGPGYFTDVLREEQHQVVPLDLEPSPFLTHLPRVVYDGARMPFADGTFDWALIITVLHHAPDPLAVVAETARVARRLIVVEDVVYSNWHKYLTWGIDSFYNLEFAGHPHSNQTEAGWRALFAEAGLGVTAVHRQWSTGLSWQRYSFGPIWSHIYVLERVESEKKEHHLNGRW